MEGKSEPNHLITKEKASSLSKNMNSAADAIVIFSLFGIALYLYNYALIKVQEGEIGSYDKFETNWEAITLGLFLLLGTIGLNYLLRGVAGIIRLLVDIKMKS